MEETEKLVVVSTAETGKEVLEDTEARLEKIIEALDLASANVKHSNTVKEDLLGESAMNNAVNICHNIQDFLYYRGYPWDQENEPKKKKKKKTKYHGIFNFR